MGGIKEILGFIFLRILSAIISLLLLILVLVRRLFKGPDFFKIKPRPTPPALAIDPKLGTHNYMSLKSQGIRLHYVEKGDKSKPLLVCLHGFPECWFSWRHQLENLSDKYWVVAVDMRGYGDSDKPTSKSAYDIKILVEDIRQFILGLGREKCILMAHDWGGAIAWQLVMKHPELFDHHISCNGPHPGAFAKILNGSWKQKFMSWYMVFFQSPWVPEFLLSLDDLAMFNDAFQTKTHKHAYSDEVIEVYKYYYSQKGALSPPIHYYRNIDFTGESGIFTNAVEAKVTVPTLIVWGSQDVALSKDMAVLASEACESAVLNFIEEASHFVQNDEPQQVNKAIREYLEKAGY